MADQNPPTGSWGSEDPQHNDQWTSLRGDAGPVFTQPVGLGLDQGPPANATGTSEPQGDERPQHPHVAGIGGAAAPGREDNQSSTF